MAQNTLLDIAKGIGTDQAVGLIEQAIYATPELSGLDNRGQVIPNVGLMRVISGLTYSSIIRTALPVAGFRAANQGIAPVKGSTENKIVKAYTLNPRWICDRAVADGWPFGPEDFITMEADSIVKGAFYQLSKQFYYGQANHSEGHPGLIDSVTSDMTVNADGSTANTGSSAYLVKFGVKDVHWVLGANGKLTMEDPRIESVVDENGAGYTAYVQELLAYVGVAVGSTNSVVRIKNLTAQSGKGLTDTLIAQAILKFPAAVRPDAIFVSRRSLGQLQASRTAHNATGAPAPFPTESQGIPVIVTDGLSDVEAITA